MKKSICLFFGFAVLFTGCGSNRNGTYTGPETANAPGTAAVQDNASLQVTSGTSSSLVGSYSGDGGTGQLTGTISSDGSSIQSVSLTMPQPATTSTVNGVPSGGCGGTYTGNLTLSNNVISGTLTLTQPAVVTTTPTTSTAPGYVPPATSSTYCSGATRGLNLTEQ